MKKQEPAIYYVEHLNVRREYSGIVIKFPTKGIIIFNFPTKRLMEGTVVVLQSKDVTQMHIPTKLSPVFR
ncbi:MAG: hypothetical protein ACXABU_14930 [Candidatus Hodarchaeales archaeon]|jgi:hypothetical protein